MDENPAAGTGDLERALQDTRGFGKARPDTQAGSTAGTAAVAAASGVRQAPTSAT